MPARHSKQDRSTFTIVLHHLLLNNILKSFEVCNLKNKLRNSETVPHSKGGRANIVLYLFFQWESEGMHM